MVGQRAGGARAGAGARRGLRSTAGLRHAAGLPRTAGLLCAVAAGLALLTWGLAAASRDGLSLASVVLLYLTAVVLVAATCGVRLALATALASDVLVNFYFVHPVHTLVVDDRDAVITLAVYVAVAVTVSVAVDLASRLRVTAARSGLEAALLARITEAPLEGGPLRAVLEQVRATYGMTGAALLAEVDGREQAVAVVGETPGAEPVLSATADDGVRLVADGPPVMAPDQRFLTLLATAAARAWHAEQLAAQAARARELAEIDRLRAALLQAVGHDLRTPLAGIKAGVSLLLEPDLRIGEEQQREVLETVDAGVERMSDLVENLLALGRLQAGVVSVSPQAVPLDSVVAAALLHCGDGGHRVEVQVPEDLTPVWADPGLLERVIANLVDNALHHCPEDTGVEVRAVPSAGASTPEQRVLLTITDHGPGIPDADLDRVFAPFQRLHDRSTHQGPGLGLAIARGFSEAMHAPLTPAHTPGGGLTMTIDLPTAPTPPAAP